MKRSRLLKLLSLGLGLSWGWPWLARAGLEGAGASSSKAAGTLSEKQWLNHGGESRSYRLYVPNPLPTKPMAAVLLLHGHGGSTDQLMGLAGRKAPYRLWLPIADLEGLMLIIPDGLVSPDGQQGWNDARNVATNPDSDDVDFLSQLVETVADSYPIDVSRLYATGISNGGHMALRLAAEASGQFAAVAAVAAANPDPIFSREPEHSVSVLLMNGTKDRFVPYEGGRMIRDRGRVQSTEDSIQYWVKHNGCEEQPRFVRYANRSRTDRCTASRTTYRNAATTAEVELIRILGGGHTEPSIHQPYARLYLAVVGRQNQDIEMADEVWRFFQGKSAL